MKEDCELCEEMASGHHSRFHRHYGSILKHRIVLDEGGFIVVPSMGQIARGSLMLLPREHSERFADMQASAMRTAAEIISRFAGLSGVPLAVFEHGAKQWTGGSCGIYHAHVHMAPLPVDASVAGLSDRLEESAFAGDLVKSWQSVRETDEYLMLTDGLGKTWLREVRSFEQDSFPSQYFRRRLALVHDRASVWDWREASQPEPALIEAFRFWTRHLEHATIGTTTQC